MPTRPVLLKKKIKNLSSLLIFRGLKLGSLWTILMLYGLQLEVLILESSGKKDDSYFLTIHYDVNMGKCSQEILNIVWLWHLTYIISGKDYLGLQIADYMQLLFLFFFQLYCTACGILAPWSGIKSMPLQVEAQSTNQSISREVPQLLRLVKITENSMYLKYYNNIMC